LEKQKVELGQIEANGKRAGDPARFCWAEFERRRVGTTSIIVARSTLHDYIDIRKFMYNMRERVSGSAEQ
jgi:hypothetical protein